MHKSAKACSGIGAKDAPLKKDEKQKMRKSALVIAALFWASVAIETQANNQELVRKFPSSHATVHYYCWHCDDSVKEHVFDVASMINFGPERAFDDLHPEETINLQYEVYQYVQVLSFNGLAENGKEVLEQIDVFCEQRGYDIEEMFLHWSEPAHFSRYGATVRFDGERNILTLQDGSTRVIENDRAMSMVWTDFYYIFDWHSEAWREFIKWRTEYLLRDRGGYAFDGIFLDVYVVPITEAFPGWISGGGLVEYGGRNPIEITADGDDVELLEDALTELNMAYPDAVFIPNAGTRFMDWAVDIMEAGDGVITEMLNYPGGLGWRESWETAIGLAQQKKYTTIYSYWDKEPADFPPGVYASKRERTHLHNAAWYWMAYVPGWVSFSASEHCCEVVDHWAQVMETDIGSPLGDPVMVDDGFVDGGRFYWELWARQYTKATVYFRGNNAWQGCDGHLNGDSIGLGENTAATFEVPAGSQLLRGDGSWVEAPPVIEHMDGFGFVLRTPEQAESGDGGDGVTDPYDTDDTESIGEGEGTDGDDSPGDSEGDPGQGTGPGPDGDSDSGGQNGDEDSGDEDSEAKTSDLPHGPFCFEGSGLCNPFEVSDAVDGDFDDKEASDEDPSGEGDLPGESCAFSRLDPRRSSARLVEILVEFFLDK